MPVLAGVDARDAEHAERGESAGRPALALAEHLHRALQRAAQRLTLTPTFIQTLYITNVKKSVQCRSNGATLDHWHTRPVPMTSDNVKQKFYGLAVARDFVRVKSIHNNKIYIHPVLLADTVAFQL